ncbi:F-box/FBD/LRR-repeat protein At1g13570-like isoform X2 [Silene latifolia]|uniref:F-box/FBD/LRR-repeat protein At1g13570-like isoform X2 n=1 Tax=Silene latifolia TaxID=37657 RepID=UPI003D76B36D
MNFHSLQHIFLTTITLFNILFTLLSVRLNRFTFHSLAEGPFLKGTKGDIAQMASSESLESVETYNDLISTMPVIVTDKILKLVPLTIAAKTSILSRTWRRNWLSCPYLAFDKAFWDGFSKVDDSVKWHKGSNIISNVLFHHNGRVDSFYLELMPKNADLLVAKNASLSQRLSLFSRTCPRKIVLFNCTGKWSNLVIMPSYIFHCNELVKLKLQCFVLNAPPFDFKGFPHLKLLELYSIKFNNGIDMLWSLIAKCPCLAFLWLEHCLGMDILDIDASSLKQLVIIGRFGSLRLKNVPRLTGVLLRSTKSEMSDTETAVASINSLASSCELQCLVIEGNLSKFLAAGGINKSLPVAFNHLDKLCLTDLILTDTDVFCFTLGMVQSCPFIKDLEISIISTTDGVQDKYEYHIDDYKLGRLHKVKITGITGTNAELKLIEYVLAISVVLENLFFKCEKLDAVSELRVLRQLIRLPRASTKAQFVCLGE